MEARSAAIRDAGPGLRLRLHPGYVLVASPQHFLRRAKIIVASADRRE